MPMAELEQILNYQLPDWVRANVSAYASSHGVTVYDAYLALLCDGLNIDQMWQIEAAIIEGAWATWH